ncbi:hypothetical protein ACH5RR_015502 [Cinchona calisaya]|uniref:Cation/H+ exchanger domain-containing protein n=1 Tax=Cinchona calisaya TaxID=153742 RepID=A0ABD2ZUK3_9GENT
MSEVEKNRAVSVTTSARRDGETEFQRQYYYGTFQGVATSQPSISPPSSEPVVGFPQPMRPPGTAVLPPYYYHHGYQAVRGYAVAEGRPIREHRLPCCGMGIGWFLFIVGFFLGAVPWYIGAFLLLCVRLDYREKPGLVACTLASILAAIAITLGVTKAKDAWGQTKDWVAWAKECTFSCLDREPGKPLGQGGSGGAGIEHHLLSIDTSTKPKMPAINFLNNPKNYSLDGVISSKLGESHTCYLAIATIEKGIWADINPLNRKLPIFITQLIIVTSITRLLLILAKPLRQPPFVAEFLAGILLGPTLTANIKPLNTFISQTIFGIPRLMMMETVANLGLNYHLFFLGLEMDITSITRVGNKALSIGISGALFSFMVGAAFYCSISYYRNNFVLGCLFWGVVLSVTGLQPVGDLLVKHKLLHSEFGRIAMSSAFVNGVVSWLLLLISAAITSSGKMFIFSLLMAVLIAAFFCYVIRPVILWVIKETQEGEEFSESTVCVILTMVLFCGLLTDMCGLSSMFGAFVFGLIIPKDVLGHRFFTVLQGFVSDLLLPLYYCSVGMRTHLNDKPESKQYDPLLMVLVVFLSFVPKLTSTLAVSYFYRIPFREGIALGVLMNAKGIVALMALTWGRDHLALDEHGYTLMILPISLMTIVASPIMGILYKPTKRFLPSKHRSLQKLRQDAELRILACIHELQTVPGITTVLEASNATKKSPIFLFALQLIRLAKHTTALLIEHGPGNGGSQSSRRIDGQTDQMIAAFEKLEQENNMFSVQPLTAMSDYATMHEDVCSIAEEKRVTLIMLPFHRRQTVHNRMEDMNPVYKEINDNILAKAPCSVGILVDRGIGMSFKKEGDAENDNIRVSMIYIGGADDREALTLAWRMAGHPKLTLTVFRFIPGDNASNQVEPLGLEENSSGAGSVRVDIGTEKQQDDEMITDFRQKTTDRESITYLEKESNNGAETVEVMRSLAERFDLFVVGRGRGVISSLKAGLDDWSDFPELGSLGDLLISSDFPSTTSVLVVQQYVEINAKKHESTATSRGHKKEIDLDEDS